MKTLLLITALTAMAADVSITDIETMPLEQLSEAVGDIAETSTDTDKQLMLAIASLRLGDHDKAILMFESLQGTPAEARSDYYLGLLAELRGDFDDAYRYYSLAADQYDDMDAQAFADNALFLLPMSRAAAQPNAAKRSFIYANASAKTVDGLVDPDESISIDEADTALDVLIAGNLSLLHGSQWDLNLGGNFYNEAYSEFDEYDVQVLGGWLQSNSKLGDHVLRIQFGVSTVDLGGEDYLSFTDLSLSDTIALDARWDLRVGALLRDIRSDNPDYDYFAGDAWQLSAELNGRNGNPWQFSYAFRNEDRGFDSVIYENVIGLPLQGSLAFSRRFHQIAGRYEFVWANGWEQSLRGTVRTIDYTDPSRFLENESDLRLTERTRDGFRWSIESEIGIPIGDRFRLLGTLEFFDEDSNINQYDYASTQFGIGFDAIF
ncbi:MAG: tetratricopeptide repeat protein [Pseudomonadota bacterium]